MIWNSIGIPSSNDDPFQKEILGKWAPKDGAPSSTNYHLPLRIYSSDRYLERLVTAEICPIMISVLIASARGVNPFFRLDSRIPNFQSGMLISSMFSELIG